MKYKNHQVKYPKVKFKITISQITICYQFNLLKLAKASHSLTCLVYLKYHFWKIIEIKLTPIFNLNFNFEVY